MLLSAAFFAPELLGNRVAATANMSLWRPWSQYATEAEKAAGSHNPDCNLSYYPRRFLLRQAWDEKTLPLWNPYSFCGTPFLADVQVGALYPVNWLLLFADPARALGLFLFIHVALGGLGIFCLTRFFGVSPGVALASACAGAVNGYFVIHFGQPTFLAACAWIPWVLFAALRLLEAPSLRRAGELALCGSALFLGGQPQTAFHALYAATLVLGVTILSRAPSPSAAGFAGIKVLPFCGLAAVLALLVVSAQLLPTLELVRHSARSSLPYDTILSGAFHPVDLLRFLVPEFFGTPLTNDEWSALFPRGDGYYIRHQLNAIFAGGPIFLLAVLGMVAPSTRGKALPFTAVFVVALLIGFGSPLARLAYELPGFRFARIDRIGSLIVMAQFVPAALAADWLSSRGRRTRAVAGGTLLLVAVCLLGFVTLAGDSLPRVLGADSTHLPGQRLDAARVAHVFERTRMAAVFLAAAGLSLFLPWGRVAAALPLALSAGQLFLYGAAYRGDRDPETFFRATPEIEHLRAILQGGGTPGRFLRFQRDWPSLPYPLSSILPPSMNAVFGLRDLQGYNAIADRRLGEALELAFGEDVFSYGIWAGRRIVAPTEIPALEHPLLDILAVKAVVAPRPFSCSGWTAQPGRGFTILENEEALPRIRLAASGRGVNEEELRARLARGDLAREECLWIGEGSLSPGARNELSRAGEDSLEVLLDGWNEIEARVVALEERILVIADSFSEGWRAEIDETPVEIFPAWGLVRAVRVPEGSHVVRFEYRPSSVRRGAILSSLGLLATIFALALPRRGRLSGGTSLSGNL
jgi:hypothetical protein